MRSSFIDVSFREDEKFFKKGFFRKMKTKRSTITGMLIYERS
jgi:putative NIF3 family GTP cyclohydrolase 1 type 2